MYVKDRVPGVLFWIVAMLTATLVACGGGGGGSSNPSTPAPSALSYPAPPAFDAGTAIEVLTPTVTGTVASYSVTPALPSGLSLSTTTGEIAGTPTVASAAANYTVTASNAGGRTTATISITVNSVPVVFHYSSPAYGFLVGIPSAPQVPTVGGPFSFDSYSSDPLPAGLSIDSHGVISGTPTAASPRANYRFSATSAGGTTTTNLSIAVGSETVLDPGHATGIDDIKMSGQRALSHSVWPNVALWNTVTREKLYSRNLDCSTNCGDSTALNGNTAVVRTTTGLVVRSAIDGSALSNIPLAPAVGTRWQLASDGSYICATMTTGLKAWSPTGTLMLDRVGNYSTALVFAAPGELRIGAGPAGANVIEKIALPGGAVSVSQDYFGNMQSWFLDGERFLTLVGNFVRVYSKDVLLEDSATLRDHIGLAGRGNWFWLEDTHLDIFKVGSSAAPTATYVLNYAKDVLRLNNGLGVLPDNSSDLTIIDLTGAALAETTVTLPLDRPSAVQMNSLVDRMFGNGSGLLKGEIPGVATLQSYTLGAVRGLAANEQRFAISTADGIIRHFDSATHALQGTIPFSAGKLALSADGTILLAQGTSLRFYGLPAGNLIREVLYDTSGPQLLDSMLSASGTVFGEHLSASGIPSVYHHVVSELSGATIVDFSFSEVNGAPGVLRISPSGTLSASTQGTIRDIATVIIRQGALPVAEKRGSIVGWLNDDSRMLVNRYETPGLGALNYSGVDILGPTGQLITSWPSSVFPELRVIQAIGSNEMYSPEKFRVYDTSNGATLWAYGSASSSSNPAGSAPTLTHVLTIADSAVKAIPR